MRKLPRSDLYPPLGEEKREIPSRPGSLWEESEAGGKQPQLSSHPGRWVMEGEEGVLVALQEGEQVAPAHRNEVWEGGNDGVDGYERERQGKLPGFVTGPVSLAEPTWRWR